MTINVNRTISAHPLKCLTVDGPSGGSIGHTYLEIDSDTEGPAPISLSETLLFFFFFYSLFPPLLNQ